MAKKANIEIEITDTWIRNELARRREELRKNPRATFKQEYTCREVRGFMVWFSKDQTVSLCLRIRVKRPGTKSKRKYEVLGHWVDPREIKSDTVMSVARAKTKAIILRGHFEEHGLTVAAKIPVLSAAIEEYAIARRDRKDPRTSKRKAPLPLDWDKRIERFKKMYGEYLDQPVSVLTYDLMLTKRNDFAAEAEGAPAGQPTIKGLRKVRAIFTTTMPMLKWFRDAKGYMPHAGMIEALTPEGYGKNTRFLYPGEWQKCVPHIDLLADYAGLFLRFLFLTGVRSETALGMQWDEFDLTDPDKFKDEEGREHELCVWIVPPVKGRLKGRGKGEDSEDLERRILLTGDALKIIRTMRRVFEERNAERQEYTGVWPKHVRNTWRGKRSRTQRKIEKAAGVARFNRYTLRKSHTTYLEYLQCPPALLSLTMTHTAASEEGAAPVTKEHYRHADAASRTMGAHDPLVMLAPWHLKLHRLIRDMEAGNITDELKGIQRELRRGSKSEKMRRKYDVDAKFIEVEEHAPKLRLVS